MNIRKLLSIIILAATLTAAPCFADDAKKSTAPVKPSVAAKLLDLNTATQAELEDLPAIGKVRALKIVASRPFKGKDELVSKGILSFAEYAKVKNLVIAKQGK
jgi:competence protein ComEA